MAAKNGTKNDGEDCKEAREEHHRPGRSGEDDDNKQTCLSEQSKTISLNVLLLCASDDSRVATSRTFSARAITESVAILKLDIQREFHVPVYDQKLSFGCTVMTDSKSLDFYRLKDGDQITVEYTTTVDIECAFRLMSLLRHALEFVKNAQSQLASSCRTSPMFSKMISTSLRRKDIQQCISTLFNGNERSLANAKFILNNRGLDVITSLHSLLLKQTWSKILHFDLIYFEEHVLFLLNTLYSVTPHHLRYKLIIYLNNILGSFLRVSLSSLCFPFNSYIINVRQQFKSLVAIVNAALKCLVTISLDEQHQIQIISNEEVMKQLIECLEHPDLSTKINIDVLICIQNLSYNAYTHKYLANVYLIDTLMKVADRRPYIETQCLNMDPELRSKLESDLAKYFVVMVISRLALTKAALLPTQLSTQVESFLNNFLRSVDLDVDFKLFCIWMLKARRICCLDLFPPLRLVYCSLRYSSLCRIDSLCLEAAVMSLKIILIKEDERQCLIKQGLLDYLICLPWHISEGLEAHKRAKQLLEMVGSHIPLQAPSLNNIVRAKLAATWCGLEEAMSSQMVGFVLETASSKSHEGQVETII